MQSSYVEVEVQHPSGITTYNSEELLYNSVKRGKVKKINVKCFDPMEKASWQTNINYSKTWRIS